MFSRHKLIASLLAVPALVAGVLVGTSAVPAAAAGHAGVQLISSSVALGAPSGAGNRAGRVKLGCSFRTKDCVGSFRFLPNSGTSGGGYFSYRVKPRSTAYATIYYWHDQPEVTTVANRIHKKIQFNQTRTTAADYTKWIYVEPQVRVTLSGKVTGPPGDLANTAKIQNVQVRLHDWNGRSSREVRSVPVNQATGNYSFGSYSLGINNASRPTRRLSISALVRDGSSGNWKFHQWFWRGSSGNAYGGTKYIEDSSGVTLTKYNETGFKADFSFGAIAGNVAGPSDTNVGADIRISAPPRTMPTGVRLRELDVPYCANDFATTTTNGSGHYEQTFLPASMRTENRYLVKVSSTKDSRLMRLWNNGFRSCLHARNYGTSTANLLPVPGNGIFTQNVTLQASTADVTGDLDFSGFRPTTSDLRVTLREYLPYKKILDSPIVSSVKAASNGNYVFGKVAPGTYWIESGRRTSCSAWYPSLYPNNKLYLQGADRGAERWKTVAGKYAEYQKSYAMGYVARTPPSGYKGWMYRGACVQRGTGIYIKTTVSRAQAFDNAFRSPKDATVRAGATVSGHISRIGGKTNKEMLVSIYSTQGVLVMRTAYSARSGNFTVRGLASGNYNIALNSDSWRGIGRTFTGRHTIRVTAGRAYSAGTLRAKF